MWGADLLPTATFRYAILCACVVTVATIFAIGAARRPKTLGKRIIGLTRGDLDERLPVHETRDELDRLASIVNTIVEETGRLVGPTESVSDAVSNDLPAQLSAIRAKLAASLAIESEEHLRSTAENAIADIDQALATVSALSRIADIGRRRRTGGLAEVDLRQVCISAFERFQPLAEAKSVVFRLDAPETLPVRGDFDLLNEAVANLVDNAIIRTPAGGFVEIVAKPLSGKPVIRVLDSEPGVGAFDHPGVPERFCSTEKGRRAPGGELGLSIAAAIAEMHGFALRVAYGRRGAQFEMSA